MSIIYCYIRLAFVLFILSYEWRPIHWLCVISNDSTRKSFWLEWILQCIYETKSLEEYRWRIFNSKQNRILRAFVTFGGPISKVSLKHIQTFRKIRLQMAEDWCFQSRNKILNWFIIAVESYNKKPPSLAWSSSTAGFLPSRSIQIINIRNF